MKIAGAVLLLWLTSLNTGAAESDKSPDSEKSASPLTTKQETIKVEPLEPKESPEPDKPAKLVTEETAKQNTAKENTATEDTTEQKPAKENTAQNTEAEGIKFCDKDCQIKNQNLKDIQKAAKAPSTENSLLADKKYSKFKSCCTHICGKKHTGEPVPPEELTLPDRMFPSIPCPPPFYCNPRHIVYNSCKN